MSSRLERIVAACGGMLLNGGTRALIPGPNHSHKDRSVSLRLTEEGRILIYCFSPKDDWRDVRAALLGSGLLTPNDQNMASISAPRKAAILQPETETRVARARRIWTEGSLLAGTVGERYLLARAIPLELTRSAALRFHPAMTSLDDRLRRPALLAAITAADSTVQGVQVTLLSKHGAAKAALPTPRRVIGRLVGGCVRLHDSDYALAIGEGVETMLSASAALGLPAWGALSAHNLSLFEPPPEIKRLVVAIDNDASGLAAGEAIKARLSIGVEILAPPAGVKDWNDLDGAPDAPYRESQTRTT